MANNPVLQQQDDEEFSIRRQTLLKKYPANQIISDKYTGDEHLSFRLMYKFLLQSLKSLFETNNTKLIPSKIRNPSLEQYANLYKYEDGLGGYYFSKFNDVVYMKFNNTKWNKNDKKKIELAAMYVPFNSLKQIHRNNIQCIFQGLPDINYNDYAVDPFKSFAKNSKGLSFDPKFSSNYSSSNLFLAIRKQPFEYDLILQNDVNANTGISEFNFAVNFTEEGYYTFNIVNLTDQSFLYRNGKKIAYFFHGNETQNIIQTDQQWQIGGQNIQFKENSIKRQNNPCKSYFTLSFCFRCKNKNDKVIFASRVPYYPLHFERFFQNLCDKRGKQMIKFQKHEICNTFLGYPMISYIISKRKGGGQQQQVLLSQNSSTGVRNNTKSKTTNLASINRSIFANNSQNNDRSIVFITGQQSKETQIGFFLQGVIDLLMSSQSYDQIKKIHKFYFIPFVNIDGFNNGSSKCNLSGSNLRHVWNTANRDYHPQIYQLKRYLMDIDRQAAITAIFDLTVDDESLKCSFEGKCVDSINTEDPRIFPYLLAKKNKNVTFQKVKFERKAHYKKVVEVLADLFPKSLNYTFKISNFNMKEIEEQDQEGQYHKVEKYFSHTPNTLRQFGKQFFNNFLEYLKLLHKNSHLRQKWCSQVAQIDTASDENQIESDSSEDEQINQKFTKQFIFLESENGEEILRNSVILKHSPIKFIKNVGKRSNPFRLKKKQTLKIAKNNGFVINQKPGTKLENEIQKQIQKQLPLLKSINQNTESRQSIKQQLSLMQIQNKKSILKDQRKKFPIFEESSSINRDINHSKKDVYHFKNAIKSNLQDALAEKMANKQYLQRLIQGHH